MLSLLKAKLFEKTKKTLLFVLIELEKPVLAVDFRIKYIDWNVMALKIKFTNCLTLSKKLKVTSVEAA